MSKLVHLIVIPQSRISVGDFDILRLQTGTFIIRHRDGEAMECTEDELEKALLEFWKEAF